MAYETFIDPTKYRVIYALQRWMRPLMAVGVVLLSALVAYVGASHDMVMLATVALVGALIGVVILFKYPSLGIIALVASLMITYDGPSHLNVSMVLVVGLFGIWLLEVLFTQQNLGIGASKSYYPLIALVLVSIMAFGVGQLPWYPLAHPAPIGAQLAGLSMFVLSAIVFFLASKQIRTLRWLEITVGIFLLIGAAYVFGELILPLGTLMAKVMSGYAQGSMFWTWLVALALGQVIFNEKMHVVLRISLLLFTLLLLYNNVVIGQDWKSGWLPPLAVVVVLLMLWSWKWAVLAIFGGGTLAPSFIAKIIASDEYSYSTRLDAWLIVAEIVKVNPISGLGPSNYRWYTPLFRIRGYAVYFNSHNQYVDIVAQIGLFGLAAYFWFFGVVGWLGWKLRTRVPRGFARAYVYSVLAGLAGTLVAGVLGDWVIPFFYNITLGGFRASMLPWLFLGGLVAIEQMYRTESGQ